MNLVRAANQVDPNLTSLGVGIDSVVPDLEADVQDIARGEAGELVLVLHFEVGDADIDERAHVRVDCRVERVVGRVGAVHQSEHRPEVLPLGVTRSRPDRVQRHRPGVLGRCVLEQGHLGEAVLVVVQQPVPPVVMGPDAVVVRIATNTLGYRAVDVHIDRCGGSGVSRLERNCDLLGGGVQGQRELEQVVARIVAHAAASREVSVVVVRAGGPDLVAGAGLLVAEGEGRVASRAQHHVVGAGDGGVVRPAVVAGLEEGDERELVRVGCLEVCEGRGGAVHARWAPVGADVLAEHRVAGADSIEWHLLLLQPGPLEGLVLIGHHSR